MKSDQFEDPRLYVKSAEELSLSGQALRELMQEVLARGKSFRFRARGWSMSPFIRDGDVITVSPFFQSPPRVGEVVAFIRPGTSNLVVHRIVARDDPGVMIRGDNGLETIDGVVPLNNLLGRVTQVERNGHSVWLGLGPERYMIAWLSHTGWLTPFRTALSSWLKPFLRRTR